MGLEGRGKRVGLNPGLEEDHSATCRHDKDQYGFPALAKGGGVIHTIIGFAPDSHGFQDGGGHIHNIVGDSTDTPTGFQRLTHHIGECELK